MPRKYHRPPDTTKRRKIRKTSIPQSGEPDVDADIPESENGALEAPVTAISVADPEPEPEDSPRLKGTLRTAAASGSDRHVGRDYSYIVGDLVRVSAIATFLVIALVITAILR